MDEKKFINLFRSLQSVMRCPSCESVYEVSETQFVGSTDGYFLLSLNCAKCSLPVWVNVFTGNGAPKELYSDLTVNDLFLSGRGPIESDEVINFHDFLKKFDGDFRKILK